MTGGAHSPGSPGIADSKIVQLPVTSKQPKRGGGSGPGGGGGDMTEITREEVVDKIAISEARTDTKFAELLGEIRVMSSEMRHQSEAISGVRTELRDDYKNTRRMILATVIGSAIAIAAVILTEQGNMLSAFEVGLTAFANHSANELSGTQSPQGTATKKQP